MPVLTGQRCLWYFREVYKPRFFFTGRFFTKRIAIIARRDYICPRRRILERREENPLLPTAHSFAAPRTDHISFNKTFNNNMSADNPILNSPYLEALLHYNTDSEGSLDYTDIRKGNIKNQLIGKIQSI